MNINIIYQIKDNPDQIRFLRENSYWYKQLNRDPKNYQKFISEMKVKYKLTPQDKLNKLNNNIDLIRTFLDVLK